MALVLALSALVTVRAAEIGKAFASPEEAVSALGAAVSAQDTNAFSVIFGSAAADLENPDRVQAANDLSTFTAAFGQTRRIVHESDSRCVLEVGDKFWPFPVPIVKKDGQWLFDTEAGKEELLNRRIGGNELEALQAARAYVAAQREYAEKDYDGDEVLEYAQKFISTPGMKDGLYWQPDLNGELSPLGPLVAQAQAQGYTARSRETRRSARAVPRLLLQDPHPPGPARARRQVQLRHQWQHDRRLRPRRLACELRQFRHHDLHREPAGPGLSTGLRTEDGQDCREDEGLRSRRNLERVAGLNKQ